jgi:hypothetical protein
MISYYYIEQETEEVTTAAEESGFSITQWYPAGNMASAACWMYNHKKLENLPEDFPHYKPDRAVQEIDPEKLYQTTDNIIRRSGWEGPPQMFNSYLCPNYEDYTCITHPGPEQNLSQEQSFRNHVRLIELMRARYPEALLANWGLPQYATQWGNFDILGYQMLGQLTWMYDIGAVSVYQLGREDDLEFTQDRLDWYARWDMPLVVYINVWEKHKTVHGGDGLWHVCPAPKLQEIVDMTLETPNVVGVELWSMVTHRMIEQGKLHPMIDSPQIIDDQHVRTLRYVGKMVDIRNGGTA